MLTGSTETLQRALVYLEKNPLAETLFKDVTGFNIPRLSLTRSPNEFFDTLTNEISNSTITLTGTLTLPQIFHRLSARASQVPLKSLTSEITHHTQAQTEAAVKLARLGASFGFMTILGALFWAVPFFRNWLTLKRTKSSNFEHLIGLAKPKDKVDNKQLEADKRWQANHIKAVLATGFALAAASLLGFGAAAKLAGKQANRFSGPTLEWMFHHFDLKGPQANQLAPLWATLFFWALPAYFGNLHASRSNNEFKENIVKTINSNLWFFFLQPAVGKAFLKAFQQIDPAIQKTSPQFEDILAMVDGPIKEKLLKLKNIQFAVGLAISISMLAATPQLINIALTRKRFEKQQQETLQKKLHDEHQPIERKMLPFQTFFPSMKAAEASS